MTTSLSSLIVPAVVSLALVLWSPSTPAQEKAPKPPAPPTSGAPTSGVTAAEPPDATPFAYAAPAFIKELDTRYPAQPLVPPSPPRYGGVLHFPATVRAFDPTVGYRPELALVWDTLTEWEATWYFPDVQRTPM